MARKTARMRRKRRTEAGDPVGAVVVEGLEELEEVHRRHEHDRRAVHDDQDPALEEVAHGLVRPLGGLVLGKGRERVLRGELLDIARGLDGVEVDLPQAFLEPRSNSGSGHPLQVGEGHRGIRPLPQGQFLELELRRADLLAQQGRVDPEALG